MRKGLGGGFGFIDGHFTRSLRFSLFRLRSILWQPCGDLACDRSDLSASLNGRRRHSFCDGISGDIADKESFGRNVKSATRCREPLRVALFASSDAVANLCGDESHWKACCEKTRRERCAQIVEPMSRNPRSRRPVPFGNFSSLVGQGVANE